MPHKFGINSPQSVKHISRKAFFKRALERVFKIIPVKYKAHLTESIFQTRSGIPHTPFTIKKVFPATLVNLPAFHLLRVPI